MRIIMYFVLAIAFGAAVGAYLGSGDQHTANSVPSNPTEENDVDLSTERYAADAAPADREHRLLWDIAGESDFTAAEKSLIRNGALKVLAEEPNCREIITGYYSGSRKGAYYVTCNAMRGAPFNVWFTPDEVNADAALGVPVAFPEEAAREACKAAIEDHVVHPSTLEVHGLLGYASEVHNNGNRTVVQEFTASNSFGADLRYTATCLILPTGALDFHVRESR